MIYMEPSALGWEPLLLSWINTLPPAINEFHKTMLKGLFKRFCEPLLWLVRKGGARVSIVRFINIFSFLNCAVASFEWDFDSIFSVIVPSLIYAGSGLPICERSYSPLFQVKPTSRA